MSPLKLIVANWKMNMPLKSMRAFVQNYHQLKDLSTNPNAQVVICPSFPFLVFLGAETLNSNILLGAQNCSDHAQGAYTGQVSAQMLADVAVDYCIIGHSECRSMLKETNEQITAKAVQLVEQQIIPIVCIGESKQEQETGKTEQALQTQLGPVIAALKNYTGTLCIAYEPVWAIGTGMVPTTTELHRTILFLNSYLEKELPLCTITVLYGGSVDENNAAEILRIPQLGGLLIGGASLDFKKFQKIVSLAV